MKTNRKWLLAFCVAVKALIYGFGAGNYGFLSDELYFLDTGAHPAFGYVDLPPMLAWLAAALQWAYSASRCGPCDCCPPAAGFCVTWLAVGNLSGCSAGGDSRNGSTAIIVLLAPGFGVDTGDLHDERVRISSGGALALWLVIRYLDGYERRYHAGGRPCRSASAS